MLRPDTFALTLLLALLTGLGPLSVDMYLASLPDIGRLLGAPPSQVQLTISLYLVGFALGQMLYGPLSDRHGRRPVLLAALGIYVLASVCCALAPSIELLIAARFFQALGGAGAIVLARAVVRDMYEGPRVGRELSRLAAIMALAPLVAPLIGGVLQTAFGWRSNFVVLFGVGLAALAMAWFLLPETLRQRAPEPVSIMGTLRAYRAFLRDRAFLANLGVATCCVAGLFAWISTAAFVLQDLYGLSAFAFGIAFAAASVGYLAGTTLAARFVMTWGSDRTMGFGSLAMAAGGVLMALVLLLGWFLPAALVVGPWLFLLGMGMTLPQAQAGALIPFPDRAGAASSLLGIVQQVAAAAVGTLLGHVLASTAWPLALAMAVAGCVVLLLWWLTRDIRAG
jgi:DHA1 family bicyclomycin/chloramphenicol resistance-like MFS transporter